MAYNKPGVAGEFRGKIGEAVICRWGKLIVGRASPKKTTKKPTVPVKIQRSKMSLISSFLSRQNGAIKIGFVSKKRLKTAMNIAVEQNINTAILGNYPAFVIDIPKIQLSKGWLDQVYMPKFAKTENERVKISWLNAANLKMGVEENDLVQFNFYNETPINGKNYSMFFKNSATRIGGSVELNLSRSFIGTIHAWMFLTSADGKKVSNTKYLGTVQISNPVPADLSENK